MIDEFNEELLVKFFQLCHERYMILRRRRRGEDPPWTEDELLRDHHFCNVFRSDDKTSVEAHRLIQEATSPAAQLQRAIICRLTNRAENLEALVNNPALLLGDTVKINTAAYRLNTPRGINNREGILELIRTPRPGLAHALHACTSLQEAHKTLARQPYLGGFTGYQIVLDLLAVGFWPEDLDADWAWIGPGAARGLKALMGDEMNYSWRSSEYRWTIGWRLEGGNSEVDQQLLRKLAYWVMQYWPHCWPRFTIHESEWMLCEFDKYLRKSKPGAPRGRRYNPSR